MKAVHSVACSADLMVVCWAEMKADNLVASKAARKVARMVGR